MSIEALRPARFAGVVVLALLAALCVACGPATQTEAPAPPLRRYVALGDTFAAAPYTGDTVTAKGCKRSKGNYPARLKRLLKIKEVTDVSCTDAPVKAATKAVKLHGHRLKAQVKAVQRDTDLVTVQFGAYDEDLYGKIVDLCKKDSAFKCRLSVVAAGTQGVIGKLRQQLGKVIRKIGDRAPNAVIVAVGYPRHVDASSHCKAIKGTEKLDRRTWARIDRTLNLAAIQAARDTGAEYVDVYAASKKHGICDKVPWVRPAQTDHDQGIAFGPTAAGQKAIARLIAADVKSDEHFDFG